MTDRFDTCHAITAKWEGGWSDHKADPGGKTMYGVTEKVYHRWLKAQGRTVKLVCGITMVEVLAIYREEYWKPTAARYNLRPGVDLAAYDAGVNAGVGRAVQWLMASVGGSDVETVKGICRRRLSFKQGLAIWKTFGKGWARRVADIEARGVAMALAALGELHNVPQQLDEEAADARRKAARQDGGAVVTGSGGIGAGGGTAAQPDVLATDATAGWILLAILLAAAGATAFLIWRGRVNRQRQAAYEAVAAELAVQP